MKMGHNVYLTGSAGSGKTHVLNQYIKYLKDNDVDVGVTASTGIAATHMSGVTIHSWAGLGIKDALTERDIDEMEERQYLWKRFERARVLVIDEVSMLHHFRLDLVDRVCKSFKRNELPFGGLQVILCGDFFQLPPIRRQNEPESKFIHHADSWKKMNLKICYLHEQFRQSDSVFLRILSDIRANAVSEDTVEHLQSRYDKDPETIDQLTRLYTHNIDVDRINDKELEQLPGDAHVFEMFTRGRPPLVETLKKGCLAPETLRLKIGTRVMFVKNNYEAKYVNGTLGKVVSFDEEGLPVVETSTGTYITAKPESWSVDENGKVLAEISQIPLRLAWAITVHKSQGMSLDAVEVDLSKSFEEGMGYVALSRVRTLEGLKLLGLNAMALRVNKEVIELDKELQEASDAAVDELNEIPSEKIQKMQKIFLDSIRSSKKEKTQKLPTHHITKLLVDEKKSIKKIAEERGVTAETIVDHIEKLQKEARDAGEDIDIEYIKKEEFKNGRFEKIEAAFIESYKQHGDFRLSPVKDKVGKGASYLEIRIARLFLDIPC